MISSFQITKLKVPLGRMIGDNNCSYEAFEVCALKLVTKDGLEGWGFGESAHAGRFRKPVPWKMEMVSEGEIVRLMETSVCPFLRDRSVEEALAEVPMPWMDWGIPRYLHAAIRMALWDLKGKAVDQPLHELLGKGEECNAELLFYSSPCAFPQPTDWLVRYFKQQVKSGFKAIKVKVGHEDMDWDLERIKAVREAVGTEIDIAVDANTAWDGAGTLRWMEKAENEGLQIRYVEDPVRPDDLDSYRLLGKEAPLRIVGHDYVADPEKLRPLLDTGALDGIRMRDGIDFARAVADLAGEYDLRLIQCNAFGEHSIHFSLSCPRVERMEFADLGWNRLFLDPVGCVQGRLIPPDGPGLGLVPDPERMAEWRYDAQEAQAR